MRAATSGQLVSFGGNTVKVHSDHPLIAAALQTHFRHCLPHAGQTDVIANFNVTAASDTQFTGSVDGSDLFSNVNYERALWLVMNEVITRLNADCVRGLVFHAAALAKDGEAVILCGQSGSGKSSLAARLTADGFQYMADEVIEMPLEGDHINGLTRSICLKSGSAFIWQDRPPQSDVRGLLRFTDGSAWIDPQVLNPNAIAFTATPRTLVFPRYVPDAPLQTQELSAAEALFRLMQTLVNARNLPHYGMEAAARLARQATAFSLIYSDVENACKWIQQTIQKSSR